MSIKVTEVGKIFNYGTGFDLSSSTTLGLIFTSPSDAKSTIANPRVTAPAVPVTDPILGTLPASTYMQFTTESTDFTEAGTWMVCGIYEDVTPKEFFGDEATFQVGEKCS